MNPKEKELFENCGVSKAIFRLAFPTVIGQIILVVYNMADIFFVGLAGSDAMMTAVTVCMPAFMFLSAISNLFGVGGASVISRALGKKKEDRVKAASAFAFWGCLTTVLLYSGLTFIGRHWFADLLGGTNSGVHKNAVEYLVVTVVIGGAALNMLIGVFWIVPFIALCVRRKHDLGKSGWTVLFDGRAHSDLWWQPSEPTENRYGPPPADADPAKR